MKKLLILSLLAVSLPAMAIDDKLDGYQKAVEKATASPKSVRPVPVAGFFYIETDNGPMLVSDNRRLVIHDFKAVDLFTGQKIEKSVDLDVLKKLDLEKAGYDEKTMATLRYGSGSKLVTVFVDPNCPHCHKLMAQMSSLRDEYTFRLVLVPLLGPNSQDTAAKIFCLKDSPKAAATLVSGVYTSVPEPTECDTSALAASMGFAEKMGIQGVPFIVTHTGMVNPGGMKDLAGYLSTEGNK